MVLVDTGIDDRDLQPAACVRLASQGLPGGGTIHERDRLVEIDAIAAQRHNAGNTRKRLQFGNLIGCGKDEDGVQDRFHLACDSELPSFESAPQRCVGQVQLVLRRDVDDVAWLAWAKGASDKIRAYLLEARCADAARQNASASKRLRDNPISVY